MSETFVHVSAATHRHLFEAFETISHDCGGQAGWPYYRIPARYEPRLAEFDRSLSRLNEWQLQSFCIGDEADQEVLCLSYDLRELHEFLNEFFDGDWSSEIYPT